MESSLIFANIGAFATTILGGLGLFAPNTAAAFTSISPVGLNGRSEIRATYGGLFTSLGVFCLVAQTEMVFTVAGVAWIGAGAGRVVSVFLDRNYNPKNLGGFAIEAAIGIFLCIPKWVA